MELLKAIQSRRSIRKFKSNEVPNHTIKELLDAARLAPSGSNLQATRFVVIKSPVERMKLKECTPLPFVAHAPVIIACCIDKEAMGRPGQIAQILAAGRDMALMCCDSPHLGLVPAVMALGGHGTANMTGNIAPREMAIISTPWELSLIHI